MGKAKAAQDSRINLTKPVLLDHLLKAEKELAEEQERNNDRQAKLNLVRDHGTIVKARETDVKSIIQDFRVNLNDGLSGFEQQLYSSKEKLDEVQKAIQLEEKNLEDIFEIKKNALTLQSLLNAHQEEQINFKQAQKEAREEWAKEQQRYDDAIEERDSEQSKQWARKLEEAQYDFDKMVQKDRDLWAQEKLGRERDLHELELRVAAEVKKAKEAIKEEEQEIAALKVQVQNFDDVKQEAINEAVKKALASEKASRHFEVRSLVKDHESESRVLANDNANLKASNDRLTKENHDLQAKLEEAYGKIQQTSVEAIKGAAQAKVVVTQEAKSSNNK